MSTLRNRVQLIGRLGADPEVKTLDKGAKVARVNIAVSENYKNAQGNWEENTNWFTLVGWEQIANRMETQLRKGSLIIVEGSLIARQYTDSTGAKRNVTEVRISHFVNLDNRKSENGSNTPSSEQSNAISSVNEPTFDDSLDDGDLPF